MSQDGASGYISVDNDALGRMLGDIALNGAPEGSSVLLLSGVSEATGISDRLTAAQEVLEAAGRKVYRCVLCPEESLESVLEGELAALAPAAVVAFDTSTLERTARVLREKESAPLLYGAGSSAAIAAYLEQGARHGGGGPATSLPPGIWQWRRWWRSSPTTPMLRHRRCRFPWCARRICMIRRTRSCCSR